ncbi:hypothetical protein [Microbacterium sediminicola]|uniref:hypothetical protein n=1 Tax=Microbacterium sediminicola TaxID=415210 RepID=UPI0031D68DE6
MLAASALAGCASEGAEPEPSATGFASEAEAFAAAEATYRAYVDALNQVDLSDPTTFEEVYRWTTGDANAAARESLSQMHAKGWIKTGENEIRDVFELNNRTGVTAGVSIVACTEVATVALTDSDGNSVVSADRLDIQAWEVSLVPDPDSATRLLITDFYSWSGAPAC